MSIDISMLAKIEESRFSGQADRLEGAAVLRLNSAFNCLKIYFKYIRKPTLRVVWYVHRFTGFDMAYTYLTGGAGAD